jgi:hypothetical protein
VWFTEDPRKLSLETKFNLIEYFNKYYYVNEKNRRLILLLLNTL